jgi:hypothetical protein
MLRSRDGGRAEIEFEDGTTLRLTPNSTVQFAPSLLALKAAKCPRSGVNRDVLCCFRWPKNDSSAYCWPGLHNGVCSFAGRGQRLRMRP